MDQTPIKLSPPLAMRAPGIAAALGLLALYFLLQLLVGGVVGLLIGLTSRLSDHGPGAVHTMTQMRALLAQPDIGAMMVICTLLVSTAIVLLLARWLWPASWSLARPPGFGLAQRGHLAFYPLALLLGLALPVLGSWLTQWLAHGHAVPQDIKQLGSATSLELRIPLVLVVVSVGPLVEELLFRGVLLSALLQRMRAGWAVAISSLLFACVHLPDLGYFWYAIPNLALLAVVLAWLRLKSGSLWPAVIAHGTNNLLAVVAWFVAAHPLG